MTNQGFWQDSRHILCHQYGISVTELQMLLRAKRPQWQRAWRNGCFPRLLLLKPYLKFRLGTYIPPYPPTPPPYPPLPLRGSLVHHVNIKTALILSFSRWKSSAYNVRGVSFKLCIYDIQMVPFLWRASQEVYATVSLTVWKQSWVFFLLPW